MLVTVTSFTLSSKMIFCYELSIGMISHSLARLFVVTSGESSISIGVTIYISPLELSLKCLPLEIYSLYSTILFMRWMRDIGERSSGETSPSGIFSSYELSSSLAALDKSSST